MQRAGSRALRIANVLPVIISPWVKPVRHPLPQTARHLRDAVGTVSLRRIAPDRHQFSRAGFLAIEALGIPDVAPWIETPIGPTRGLFPFGLRRQAVWFPRGCGQPYAVTAGILPADRADRMIMFPHRGGGVRPRA